jgi:hypothetical protein
VDKDLARILATAGMRASKDLGDLVPLVAEFLPENSELRIGIAKVISEIGSKVLDPAFGAHPELRLEFEERVKKYGRTT